jgi:hypothetical protein
MTQVSIEQLSVLFGEAGSAHKRAFTATDGKDPDWPSWYAEYLAPRLQQALGRRFDVSILAADLRRVDVEHRAVGGDEPWPDFYARWFLGQPGA